jgi:hypothetical protein
MMMLILVAKYYATFGEHVYYSCDFQQYPTRASIAAVCFLVAQVAASYVWPVVTQRRLKY